MTMVLVELEGYYRQNLELLIKAMSNNLNQILEVIDKPIDEKITDDKYLNVLKAKRLAAEDFIWTLKRIGELKKELLGTDDEEEDSGAATVNLAKARAEKKRKDNDK